ASHSRLRAIEMDVQDAPDLFPPLVALCAYCPGTSVLHGVSRLTHKESDRYETLRREFGALGIDIRKEGDAMVVHGGQPGSGTVRSHGDHRIAMALATAALGAAGPVTIRDADCVAKSFPDFFERLTDLGVYVQRLA
ncbi:MAG: hypothetical protein R3330_15360, partial [Saprospiraceae bacterium]|nr:hypothetical protein [Saprospiraceae bacterium]